jgi:hypothetical protein
MRYGGTKLRKSSIKTSTKVTYRGRHKLSPPWEGPDVVVEVLKPNMYKLANEQDEVLTNAWNIQ